MESARNPYEDVFNAQKANQFKVANSSYSERIKKLNRLKKAIEVTYRAEIHEALKKDLNKPKVETELSEIFQIVSEIKHAKKYLHKWMRKQKVKTPLALLGASSYFKYEAKGVCLIISPWNFPFNLTFGPLISAIAAGNTVIIKPSEISVHSSALMAKIVTELFHKNEVALIEGDVKASTALLELPFNHIFFTGSSRVGKIVMTAAAKHLASVTLELGGKSPTIVDKTANINLAAKRIIWGKCLNSGQTCIAPDYVMVEETVKDKFIEACKKWIHHYFSENPKSSSSYARIINKTHLERLNNQLEEAKQAGAKIEIGGEIDDKNYLAPTLISNLKKDSKLLKEEIFGTILPIITFNTLGEVVQYINSKKEPLALYMYSRNHSNINIILSNTKSGGLCINNNVVHYANPNLPFGGVNASGLGKSHGFYGFEAFSNRRSVIRQGRFSIAQLLFPPYDNIKYKLAQLTVKWF